MASATSALILGVSVILAAVVFVAQPLVPELKNENVLSTTGGAVRLGKIYNETLKARLVMTHTETGEEFISVDENVDDVYEAAAAKLKKILVTSNDGLPDKEKVSFDQASLKIHMTIKLTTYVAYRSEYQPAYSLALDEHVTTAPIGARLEPTLTQLQDYCNQRKEEFFQKHQLLKI